MDLIRCLIYEFISLYRDLLLAVKYRLVRWICPENYKCVLLPMFVGGILSQCAVSQALIPTVDLIPQRDLIIPVTCRLVVHGWQASMLTKLEKIFISAPQMTTAKIIDKAPYFFGNFTYLDACSGTLAGNANLVFSAAHCDPRRDVKYHDYEYFRITAYCNNSHFQAYVEDIITLSDDQNAFDDIGIYVLTKKSEAKPTILALADPTQILTSSGCFVFGFGEKDIPVIVQAKNQRLLADVYISYLGPEPANEINPIIFDYGDSGGGLVCLNAKNPAEIILVATHSGTISVGDISRGVSQLLLSHKDKITAQLENRVEIADK